MIRIIANWVLSALCLYALAFIFNGIYFTGFAAALTAAVVLGLVNCFIKPLLKLITFPITVLTLGLFSLVINAIMLNVTSSLVSGFIIDGFFTAFCAALVLSVLNTIFIDKRKSRRKRRR